MANVPLFTEPLTVESLFRAVFELRVAIMEIRGKLASLEVRFDGSDVKKRAEELNAATEKITMDAERAIRKILESSGKPKE